MRLTALLDTLPQGGSGPWDPPQHPVTSGIGSDSAEFNRLMDTLLPCRTNDPELWFAEHSTQVEQAKALCRTCPLMAGLPRRRPRAQRALGRLGRRGLRRRRRCRTQAWPGSAAQVGERRSGLIQPQRRVRDVRPVNDHWPGEHPALGARRPDVRRPDVRRQAGRATHPQRGCGSAGRTRGSPAGSEISRHAPTAAGRCPSSWASTWPAAVAAATAASVASCVGSATCAAGWPAPATPGRHPRGPGRRTSRRPTGRAGRTARPPCPPPVPPPAGAVPRSRAAAGTAPGARRAAR